MNAYHVINYHITDRCNYHCAYCFGKFNGQPDPSPENARRVIDNIHDYFQQTGIDNPRINFAGGEPTLYTYLDELIEYTHSLGITVSVITNGHTLTPARIRSWHGLVSCIGLSIDSTIEATNRQIGRCCGHTPINLNHLRALTRAIHEGHMDLKINTVVSRYNIEEDLFPLYQELKPKKIKLLQMHVVEGINDHAKPYAISKDAFIEFCSRHACMDTKVICESCGDMENSYLMVNPNGEFQLNSNGIYQILGDLKTTPLSEILLKAPLHPEKFQSRYSAPPFLQDA